MNWLPDEKTREMDRLYRQSLLGTLLSICVVVIVACLLPRDPQREPIKYAVIFVTGVGFALSITFWFRSKIKKSGIPGGELFAYWSKKPLSRIIQLIILIGVIVNVYRVIKGK